MFSKPLQIVREKSNEMNSTVLASNTIGIDKVDPADLVRCYIYVMNTKELNTKETWQLSLQNALKHRKDADDIKKLLIAHINSNDKYLIKEFYKQSDKTIGNADTFFKDIGLMPPPPPAQDTKPKTGLSKK